MRNFQGNVQMSINEKTRSHLLPIWERILEHFMRMANKSRPHERDWRIFYEFIRYNRRKMSGVELEKRLVDGGFSAGRARNRMRIRCHSLVYSAANGR